MAGVLSCCKLRWFVVCISLAFLAAQTLVLCATVWLAASDVGEHAGAAVDWLEKRAIEARDHQAANDFRHVRDSVVRRSYDFLAIPVTASIVLLMSDALLLWSASAKQHRVLLWPWLVLHALEWAAAAAATVFLILVVPKTYLKVLVFLLCCPFLVLLAFCWFVVKCFFNYLRDLNTKEAAAKKQYPLPATVYSTSDPSNQLWDQPLPIWASSGAATNAATNSVANGGGAHWELNGHSDYDVLGPRGSSLPPFYPSDPYYKPRSVASSTRRHGVKPTMLADGTLVVPLADDDEANTIEEEEEDSDSHGGSRGGGRGGGRGGRHATSHVHSQRLPARRTHHQFVNNYRKRGLGFGARSVLSDDGTAASVVSLSDKYRQQDEVEVFEEFYPVPVAAAVAASASPPSTAADRDNSAAIPINSTKAAVAAAKKDRKLDSPNTQSTGASSDP